MMKLLEPNEIVECEFNNFINEFKNSNEELVPYSLNQKNMDFKTYIKSLVNESIGKGIHDDWVPASTFFLVDIKGKIFGAANIRHSLTAKLRKEGGHIGFGIRPSARNLGYGTLILKLALDKVLCMQIKKVLVTCDKENIYSAKVIINNDGKLDSEVEIGSKIVQRYWIEL